MPVDSNWTNKSNSIELGVVIDAIWRRILPLSIWLAICLAAASWYLSITPITFTSAATVILEPRQIIGPISSTTQMNGSQSLDVAQAESQIQVIRSERILAAVFEILQLKNAPEFAKPGPSIRELFLGLLGVQKAVDENVQDQQAAAFQAFTDRVGVRRLGQSYVLEISYQAGNAEHAARVANSIAMQYIKVQVDVKAAAARQGTEYLSGRIQNIETEQKIASEGVREGRIPDMLFSDADARIIGAALRPLNKSYPKGGLIIALAMVFGLISAILIIAVLEALDQTITSPSQIRNLLNINCAATLPKVANIKNKRRNSTLPLYKYATDNIESEFALGIQNVKVSLILSEQTSPRNLIGVLSWNHSEGRSTIASNLSFALSESNANLYLVDADIKNPTLTEVIVANEKTDSEIELHEARSQLDYVSFPVHNSLRFIPSNGTYLNGQLTDSFDSLVSIDQMLHGKFIGSAVIDLPPLSSRPDILPLIRNFDTIIVVLDHRKTTIDEAMETIRILRSAGIGNLTVVLNKWIRRSF